MKIIGIAWPALLVEVDTTGVLREDEIIHVACALVDQVDGALRVVARYQAYQDAARASSGEAFAVHGLAENVIRGHQIDSQRVRSLVGTACSIISRHPKFTAKKLQALVPECLNKRWYQYPAVIQGYPGRAFPALDRMEVLTGSVESFGYGRRHELSELTGINADHYVLVFGEDGPPEVSVKFGRRKVIAGFAETLLKCSVGARFRLHGAFDYDFITGYCNDGPAYRERAFRLANTPSNLELVDQRREVLLERIDGMTYFLGMR